MEPYISADEFDPSIFDNYNILESKRGRSERAKRYRKIIDCVCAFDIETTGLPDIEESVMYVWQFQIGTDLTVFGRTWEQYKALLVKLSEYLLNKGAYLFVYVHNLSYEFCWLKGIYDFEANEVFAVQRRKVLTCRMYDCIEYRCSYLLSNMNLRDYTRKMKVQHVKLLDYDYNMALYPWSSLSVEQLKYCQNDVLGLVEAIQAEMHVEGDTLRSIPLTSTGFVRRDIRNAINNDKHLRRDFAQRLFPTEKQYRRLREAFRGGDTHGSRFYCDTILENVHSYDRSSSYPDVLINYQYPMTPFCEQRYHITEKDLHRWIYQHNRAVLMCVRLSDLRLKDPLWGCPYVTKDKSRNISNGIFFNGRVIAADSLETTITDVDYRIIAQEYSYNIEVIELYLASYGELPASVKGVILEYYRRKSELKGSTGDDEIFYHKSKNKLNACYGMAATSPCRVPINYDKGDRDFHYDLDTPTSELLAQGKKSTFLPYTVGVWCTAHARYMLHLGIHHVIDYGKEHGTYTDFVYCDTDSVKYIGDVDWTEFNSRLQEISEKNHAYADAHGKRYYMGVYDYDGTAEKFLTCGAKKYASETGGKIKITVAGVNKRLGAVELSAHGGLKALHDGFVFTDAGGVEAIYNDTPEPAVIEKDGHRLEIISNVYLKPSTYTVGSTQEYRRIVEMSHIELDRLFTL